VTKSPAGRRSGSRADPAAAHLVPDAHDKSKRHAPIMFTTDIALKLDPAYAKIAKRFRKDPKRSRLAFAKAWFKLTHRDMGPRTRYLGARSRGGADLAGPGSRRSITARRREATSRTLKAKHPRVRAHVPELVRTAWASAATFRGTDMRGGANGARIRLAPQKDWAVNDPKELAKVLGKLEGVQKGVQPRRPAASRSRSPTLIVLGGVRRSSRRRSTAGHVVEVPFSPGRTDATQAQTDVRNRLRWLEPTADGFRNYYGGAAIGSRRRRCWSIGRIS
jgi:catalase-peroxidase